MHDTISFSNDEIISWSSGGVYFGSSFSLKEGMNICEPQSGWDA